MTKQVRAVHDPALRAIIVSRRPLLYSDGADPKQDRPPHVRAGSALAWVGDLLVVVQDDSNFLAIVDPKTKAIHSVALPAGPGGKRTFDDTTGNKKWKLDLEACFVVPTEVGPALVAFGSGSTAVRERVVSVRNPTSDKPDVRVVDAAGFYSILRAAREFSGSELNLEGATVVGDRLMIFQRGNGAPRGDLKPVNATCRIALPELRHYLADPHESAPPELEDVTVYELGTVNGIRLTFTDGAATNDGRIYYLATAEESPDAVRDGPVSGVALGTIGPDATRYALLLDDGGRPFMDKAEGLVFDKTDPKKALVVLDHDAPDRPAELCELVLEGPW